MDQKTIADLLRDSDPYGLARYIPTLQNRLAGTVVSKPPAGANEKDTPVAALPFVRASFEHVEPISDETFTPGAATVQLDLINIPAYGFVRNIIVLCTTSSNGVLGAGVAREDYPFALLDEVTLMDVNGTPLYGPLRGYETFLVNQFGGYADDPDVTAQPDYDATLIQPDFMVRVPVEITAWDGYGSLANQDAAAPYRLRIVGATNARNYSTNPTTSPTIRVRTYLEAWSMPRATDRKGTPQQQTPPGHPTTQFWSEQIVDTISGQNTIRLTKVGNLIRNLIFVLRSGGADSDTRSTTNFPDPIELRYEGRQIIVEPRYLRRAYMRERVGFAPPAGVFLYDFTHDQEGHLGNESRHLYLGTTQGDRLELVGSFGAAGQLRVLTNDVAPGGGR